MSRDLLEKFENNPHNFFSSVERFPSASGLIEIAELLVDDVVTEDDFFPTHNNTRKMNTELFKDELQIVNDNNTTPPSIEIDEDNKNIYMLASQFVKNNVNTIRHFLNKNNIKCRFLQEGVDVIIEPFNEHTVKMILHYGGNLKGKLETETLVLSLNFIRNLAYVEKMNLYLPNMNCNDANNWLAGRELGTYIVRSSSKATDQLKIMTVSFVNKNKGVSHVRFQSNSDGSITWIDKKKTFNNLIECIEAVCQKFQVPMQPLSVNPSYLMDDEVSNQFYL